MKEIYHLAIHIIGIATIIHYARRAFEWLFRPKTTSTFYTIVFFNDEDHKNRQELLEMSHKKFQQQTDPQKN